ncbi:unnamed protein product, partial [Hapterophycus canaliculatus]
AAEVCLTDGDEESLRLTEKNVRANLPSNQKAEAELHASRRTPGRTGNDKANNTEAKGGDGGRSGVHNGVGTGDSGADGADSGGRPQASDHAAKILVQKLRWGCADDMQAAGCPGEGEGSGSGSCGPWDVVLGSDIAALPYASAYDDLLQTIVSLVNSNNKSG